jgi:hypothetical protein
MPAHPHAHTHCHHTLAYCAPCDLAYCKACGREWGPRRWVTYPQYTGTTIPVWNYQGTPLETTLTNAGAALAAHTHTDEV